MLGLSVLVAMRGTNAVTAPPVPEHRCRRRPRRPYTDRMAGTDIGSGSPATTRFSGWRIVAFAIVTAALTGPGQTIGVSVFVDHFIADLDLSRDAVSGAYLAGTLLGSTAMPRVGSWIDRTGVRNAMTWIGVFFGVALIAMGGVWSLASLAVGFTFIRMLGQGSLSMVSNVAVTHWFDRRRGLAIGVMMTSVGALMGLAPVALNVSIESLGWRMSWVVAAFVIWMTVVPIGRFGMIDKPADVGQIPDGKIVELKESSIPSDSVTRTVAIRTPAFWVAASAIGTQSMLVTALSFHQIALLGEVGLTSTEAAAMFLPQVVGAAVAGILFGSLVDRFPGGRVLAGTLLLLAFSLWMVGRLDSTPSVLVYALALGASGGGIRSTGAAVLPKWFGPLHIGSITGVSSLVGVASSALGPLALSRAQAVTGSFGSAAALFIVLPLAVAVVAALTKPPTSSAATPS